MAKQVKLSLSMQWRHKVEEEAKIHSFLNWALDGDECSTLAPADLTQEKTLVPTE